MTDVILYGLPPSSYVRTAMMILACKGVPYTLTPVNFRSEEYRATHPFSRMPALKHGEVQLFESLAIGSYVDDMFDGPALIPSDPVARARMFQWISVVNDYVYDVMVRQCVAERFVKPMRGLDPDEEKIAAAKPLIATQLAVLEEALTADYLCGDTLSLADLFLAPILAYLGGTPEGRDLLPAHARLAAWQERMAQPPGYSEINPISPV